MSDKTILEVKKMNKRFGATIALRDVDFILKRGEIHGLIGENGSGKSTLSSIIAGIQKADSGEMYFRNDVHQPTSMIDALHKGVGMVVQESGTIAGISVAENIFLGESAAFKKTGFINRKKMNQEAVKALDIIQANHIAPQALTSSIDFQDRKLIEIAKVMYKNPDVLIVDETTTALSQRGRETIYELMKKMVQEDKAVIFISHDLEELIEVCNIVTVLRDGNIIKSLPKAEFNEDIIKQLMVGRELDGHYYRVDYDKEISEEVVLEATKLHKGDRLIDINLKLHKGEILGIGGLSHSGMHTLGKCLFGFESLDTGKVIVDGCAKSIVNEKTAMKSGIGYVSKDRDIEALSLKSSIKSNISIVGLDKIKSKKYLITKKNENTYVKGQVESLSIKCRTIEQAVQELSGGNKQKVVFGKWIARDSSILVLDCPTRGVDIGVKQAMYQLIYKLSQEGKSFIIISEELSELIGMCDRILIMKNGQISESFTRNENLSESDIIDSMI